MLDVGQFRSLIIKPALEAIDLYSKAAEELVLGTALQESGLKYLKQLGGGPAVGLFQMETVTHDDIWTNYLEHRSTLKQKVSSLVPVSFPAGDAKASNLVGNMNYAAAMCRIHYYRVNDPLPDAGDIEWQAAYWKRFYNTPQGHGTEQQYIDNWNKWAK